MYRLESTFYFDFTTHNPSTGEIQDADSLPIVEIFENDVDTTLAGITVTKRTAKTGNYRVEVVGTTGNGFELGKSYNAIATATVNGVTAKSRIKEFQFSIDMIVDDVWDESASAHETPDTFGHRLKSILAKIKFLSVK